MLPVIPALNETLKMSPALAQGVKRIRSVSHNLFSLSESVTFFYFHHRHGDHWQTRNLVELERFTTHTPLTPYGQLDLKSWKFFMLETCIKRIQTGRTLRSRLSPSQYENSSFQISYHSLAS